MIFNNYVLKGKTINSEYYVKLLQCCSDEKKIAIKKVLFLQDNIPVHTYIIMKAKIIEFKLKLLPCAAYSPDLFPLEYILFLALKKMSQW